MIIIAAPKNHQYEKTTFNDWLRPHLSALFSQVKTRSYIVDPQGWPRDHNVDYTHLRLDVSFDAPKGLVKGQR